MPAEITRKGRELAERRRAHLAELQETGRWKRYYTEEQFAVYMREAIALVETWNELARHAVDTRLADAADQFHAQAVLILSSRRGVAAAMTGSRGAY